MTDAKTQTTKSKCCKYLPSKVQIDLAQRLLSENSFRYFSRWAMDDSGFEVMREHDQNEAIPEKDCQEWMPVKRCIPTSDEAEEWCEIFSLAERIMLAEIL